MRARFLALLMLLMLLGACRSAPLAAPVARAGHFVDVGGNPLFFWHAPWESGQGPVALVHGAGVDARVLEPQRRDLLAFHRGVLVHDLRPYGRTPAAAVAFSHADDLRVLLARRGIYRTVVVAHGYGATVALDLAREHPDLVSCLALIAPAAEREDAAAGWVEAPAMAPALRDRAAAALLRRVAAENAGASRAGFGPLLRPGAGAAWRALAEIAAPTLVIAGDGDAAAMRLLDRVVADVPHARGVTVRGAGHFVGLDRADEVNAALRAFLAPGGGCVPRGPGLPGGA